MFSFGIFKLALALISSLVVAALAEEKATYFFALIVIVSSVIFTGFSFRKIIALFIAIVAIVIGLILLGTYYPDMLDNLIDIDSILNYATVTYDEGYRLPRLGSFFVINDLFFNNDVLSNLFGIGFGNSETSSFSFLQSNFYNRYGDYNYRWFTHQWIFIEEGYIGFITFLSIFVAMLICLLKNKNQDQDNYYKIVAIGTVLCCIASIWYNATLKVDMQYLAYFSMAIGFVGSKKDSSAFCKNVSFSNRMVKQGT